MFWRVVWCGRSIQRGDLTIRVEAKQAEVAGKVLNLTGKEYQMLDLQATHQGNTITK
jgi:two-component system cell cycle response regulator CtrA